MVKMSKRRFGILVTALILVTMAGVFSRRVSLVSALFDDEHVVAVMMRFHDEILQSSPAWPYYEALSIKHSDEMSRIYFSNPEHLKELYEIMLDLVPGLEALVNGKGDTVQITAEQIDRLKAEVDWLASAGSPSLREDIETEQQRYPLEHFIGMTMNEALDYVNSNFPPDLIVAMPQPNVLPSCFAGYDLDCAAKPTLAPNSDGEWAYYILDGVYFEYPSTWRVEGLVSEEETHCCSLIPQPDSPEGAGANPITSISLHLLILPDSSGIQYDPLTFPQTFSVFDRPAPIWNRLISLQDFEGSEFLYQGDSNIPATRLEAIFRDPDTWMTMDVYVFFQENQLNESFNDPDWVQGQFPNLRHILESLRYWQPE